MKDYSKRIDLYTNNRPAVREAKNMDDTKNLFRAPYFVNSTQVLKSEQH